MDTHSCLPGCSAVPFSENAHIPSPSCVPSPCSYNNTKESKHLNTTPSLTTLSRSPVLKPVSPRGNKDNSASSASLSNCSTFPQGGGGVVGRTSYEGERHMLSGWVFLIEEKTTPLAGRRNVVPQVALAQAASDSYLIHAHGTPKASVGTWPQAERTSVPDIHFSLINSGTLCSYSVPHRIFATLKLKHLVSKQPWPGARGQPQPGTTPKWP